jgi:hypothetical protein
VPEAGALLGVPIDRTQQRVDVDECLLLDAGQQAGVVDQVDQVRPCHRGQLQRVAVGELPQELAQSGLPNSRPIPPERITSRSSILSAPAAIPAITDMSLPAGFTQAEATLMVAI